MAITLDAAANGTEASSTSISWSHTIGNHANRLLLVGVVSYGPTITGATYGGTSMTLQASQADSLGQTLYLFYLAAPAIGTGTVVVSASSSGTLAGCSISYYNVAQAGMFGTVAKATGNSTSPANTVTTTSIQQQVIDLVDNDNFLTMTPTAGQTVEATNTSLIAFADLTATGASMTLTWTLSGARRWNEISAPLNVVPLPRVLSITLASPVQHLNLTLTEVAMTTPFTTIDSSATVKDQNGVLLSALSAFTLTVTFQDGTTSTPTVINMGSGVYTATYMTKGPGTLTELWSLTDASGAVAQEQRTLVIAY